MKWQVLSPIDRVSEVLFGLIMVLTFTGSLSIAEAGRDDVRTMLIGALGCNLAWGIIDAILHIMGKLADGSRNFFTFKALRETTDVATTRQIVANALPAPAASVLTPAELDELAARMRALPEPPARVRIGREDWLGALGVFLLVFLATFPVTVPFMIVQDAGLALRISNGIAIGLLFVTGFAFGRISGRHPWLAGMAMVVLGAALVAVTIALGG